MAKREREASKYFIEQFIVDDTNNPSTWTEEEFKERTKDNLVIGYLFLVKEGVKFGPATRLLNLYLIKPKYYQSEPEKIVVLSDLAKAWDTWMDHMFKGDEKFMCFQNPPIKEWLNTKENWCMKQADRIVQQWGWTFDDALSQVYWAVMKCYKKGHVYMGNLGYIITAINNSIGMDHRYNKNRLHGGNPLVVSGDQQAYQEDDSNDNACCSVWDTIGKDDPYYAEQDYKQFEADLRALMRADFSDREIDQIFTQRSGYLPMGLYRRLLKWRKKHSIKELRALI